ncbi:hypothetical protein FRY97_22035 [Phaeodactylibacter luteus]|uniref:Transposase n=2 Tax=Phaeodactylibacter luteus TaxID=1564516 RepID=A0A5C6RF38_9BACT|nr:hypothetical protein FRY97_22035 [Phaeodactylibacter luteus]
MMDGMCLHYIVMQNPRPGAEEELVYLLTNLHSPTQASRLYEWRWQIEVCFCFKHLKSNGVNLEAMNVQGREKRHLMMAIAVLVYISYQRGADKRAAGRYPMGPRQGFRLRV